MVDEIAGIYACYYSSTEGYGAAIFLAFQGKLTGVDPNGVLLDGFYGKAGGCYRLKVLVDAPAGTQLVQGGEAGPKGQKYEVEVPFKESLTEQPFFEVDTPLGPLNVRFQKLRDLDDGD